MEATETEVICGSCGAVSFPPRTENVHEAHCPLSPQNQAGTKYEVNGQPARVVNNPPLVELSLDEVIGVVADLQAKVAVVSSERGRVSKRLKDLKEARDKAVAEMIVKWRSAHGMEPLPLDVEVDDEEDGE